MAEQEQINDRVNAVRTGLTFGAVAYGFTGDLEFAEMVNGFAEAAGGTAAGDNGMSPTN